MKKLLLQTTLLLATSAAIHAQNVQYLDPGAIRSLVGTSGHLWWDTSTGAPRCEFPKGSGKHVGFAAGLWVGGYDTQGQLKVAANTYRQNGNDYWQGPIAASGGSTPALQAQWDKIWRVTRADMDSFFAVSNHTLANTPQAILRWPGRGNTAAVGATGVSLNLGSLTGDFAPFIDVNGDGVYNALSGDYPRFQGDQMLWQMYNDAGGAKTSTNTVALSIQIGMLAWAYNRGTVADNIQYYEYTIANRGGQIDSTVVSVFTDFDLGFATDDYMGFDSARRMGYNYNSAAVDGSGQTGAYGNQVPVAGVALMRAVGDAPLAGYREPAGAFTYFTNIGMGFPVEITDPTTGTEFYRYMTGSTKLGNPFTRDFTGQQGIPTKGYGAGPSTRYVFDGAPGTSGAWSECFSGNPAGDRRFLLSSSAFVLPAGEGRTVAMALVVSPNAGGCPNVSLTGLQQTVDTAIKLYNNPPPFVPNGVRELSAGTRTLEVYPSPATHTLFVTADNGTPTGTIAVIDATGRRFALPILRSGATWSVDVRALPAGVYGLVMERSSGRAAARFVKQ